MKELQSVPCESQLRNGLSDSGVQDWVPRISAIPSGPLCEAGGNHHWNLFAQAWDGTGRADTDELAA